MVPTSCIAKIRDRIVRSHYTHSVPSGKSRYYVFEEAVVIFAIPANYNISTYVVGVPNKVWELARLWAPNNHRKNLLTQALANTVRAFHLDEPGVLALVSYADPNAGHLGGVYRAASWVYTGQSSESRAYRAPDGQIVSRRKFHTGSTGLKKADIEALGYKQMKLSGKHRFVKGLTRQARRYIERKFNAGAEQ